MKLHTNVNTVERSEQFEESNFSIEASAKAFFILSDGLYSNKVKAVIRELSANAYDSHVDAGCPETPFEVHLPTQMEPYFHIKDFGVGLSHEDCMKLYTTYFYSNKTDRNDAVGCLGLGSKSPFAYVDSFTVESYYEGTHRVYTAYKNEDSNPVFALLNESATDEPNGLKVTVSVEKDDFHDFQWEATELYKFFDTKPTFVGKEVEFHDKEVLLEGDYWKFVGGYNNYIIMGQIAYPIDEDQFSEETKAGKFLSRCSGLELKCDIGKVDITPSREALSYNNTTKQAIESLLDDISEEIGEKIQTDIQGQPTLFAARNKFLDLLDSCRALKVTVEHLDKGIMWEDEALFESAMGYYVNSEYSFRIYSRDNWRETISMDSAVHKVHFGNRFSYIYDDLKRGGVGRTRQWMKEQSGSKTAHFFRHTEWSVEEVCDLLSCDPSDLTLTSSLDATPSISRSYSGGGGGSRAAVYENGSFTECKVSVKQENAYYVLESRGRIESFYKQTTFLARAIEQLEKFGHDFSDYNIFLVKPSAARTMKLDERKNWESFMPIFQQKIRETIADHEEDIKMVLCKSKFSSWDDEIMEKICKRTKTDNKLDELFKSYSDIISKAKAVEDEVREILRLASGWGVNHSLEEGVVSFKDQFEDLMSRYPMIKVLDDNSTNWGRHLEDEEITHVANYIDMMEMKESTNV